MKKTVNTLILIAALAVTFQAGAWYHQRTAVSASTEGPRLLHYACPMHPQHVADRPGECGACGMDLEPVYAGERTAPDAAHAALPPGAVGVSARQQQLIGVQVQTVGNEAPRDHLLRFQGRIAADERRDYTLNAGLEGTIREVFGVTTGSRVRKNQLLATYTAPDFLLAVQSYILALDGLDKLRAGREQDSAARAAVGGTIAMDVAGLPPIISKNEGGLVVNSGSSNFQQRIDRLHLLGMSDYQIEEIRRMRDVPAAIKIVAPADGIVLSRNVKPAYKFARGEEWFRIADLRRVWVLVDVPGAEVQHVRAGQPVQFRIPEQGRTYQGRVSDVAPVFDAETRTFKVRLEADNPGEVLRPDMFVDVELPVSSPATLTVPAEAVLDTGLRKVVYVEEAPGAFEPREVTTGWRRGGLVEVLSGLSAGDRIVTSGSFLLDSESRMRAAISESRAQ